MKIVKPTIEEAQEFFDSLFKENKFLINVQKLPAGEGYECQWIEQKSYTAVDGKVFPDEVWITQEGDMKLVQELDPEHCRNILRLILRQERKLIEKAADELCNTMFGDLDSDQSDTSVETKCNHTLH